MAKTKKRSSYLMEVRKIILFQDGDNGRKLSALYGRKKDNESLLMTNPPSFLIQNFCNDSNTRETLFLVCWQQGTVRQRNCDDLHSWNISISEFSDSSTLTASKYTIDWLNKIQKLCQKWDSNPRLQMETRTLVRWCSASLTWVWRLRPLGHPDLYLERSS